MKKTLSLMIGIGFLGVMMFAWMAPANAAPQFQPTPFPTPTPGADGRILYTAQRDDTLWRIAAVAGVSLEELRQLNNMGPDDVLLEGQVVLLGLGNQGEAPPVEPGETQPVEAGAEPGAESGPTLIMDAGEVCVLLFADINGDALRQENELGILGGEVSVTERLGTYSDKKPTKAGDPDDTNADVLTCFEDAPPGTYNVTMAIPEGWNETTVLSKTFDLAPGDTSYLNFGAQLGGVGAAQETGDVGGEDGGRSPILGILGIFLLLGGAGLGIYFMYANQQGRAGGD
jgi:hypothetical protein